MKKGIFVKVAGIKNKNLKEFKKVKDAIGTIREFARRSKNLGSDPYSIDEKITLQGEEDTENNLYISMTVEVDGLEDITIRN